MRRAAKSIRKACTGTFRNIKWAVLVVTLGIYYLLPFVRWDRGPNAPAGRADRFSQPALLFLLHRDLAAGGLLPHRPADPRGDGAVPDERGRRPRLVRLSLPADGVDRSVPRHRALVEGDRREHMQRDARNWTADTYIRKGIKHFLWLMVAWWTGGAWVLYFADAPTLVKDLATGQAPLIAYVWIGILTFTTYALAGHMREQVCLYMCPWPRIQAALTDEYALNVTYRYDRGEPRGSVKKAEQLRAQGSRPATASIACNASMSARPASISAAGPISAASSAGCASMPATRS